MNSQTPWAGGLLGCFSCSWRISISSFYHSSEGCGHSVRIINSPFCKITTPSNVFGWGSIPKRECGRSQSSVISTNRGTVSRVFVVSLLLISQKIYLIKNEVSNSDYSLGHLGQIHDCYITHIPLVKTGDENDIYFIGISNGNASK